VSIGFENPEKKKTVGDLPHGNNGIIPLGCNKVQDSLIHSKTRLKAPLSMLPCAGEGLTIKERGLTRDSRLASQPQIRAHFTTLYSRIKCGYRFDTNTE
jgi:hypothetical protein